MIRIRIPRPRRRWIVLAFAIVTLALGYGYYRLWESVLEPMRDRIERLDDMADPTWRPK